MALNRRERRNLALGLGFLAPNILGFLAFTVIPLLFSLFLAFTNWDLKLHNMFKDEALKFVGLGNFKRLLTEPDFWRFLGNTLFLMMAAPFGIGASLLAAILLSKDLRGGNRRVFAALLASALLVASLLLLLAVGAGSTGMVVMFAGLLGGIFLLGAAGGNTLYRTLFYLPHFTSGVATFILWKKLYNPHTGPVNGFLAGPVEFLGATVRRCDPVLIRCGLFVGFALAVALLFLGLHRVCRMWNDGDIGSAATVLPAGLLALPFIFMLWWSPSVSAARAGLALTAMGLLAIAFRCTRGQEFSCDKTEGTGTGLMFASVLMVAEFVFLGLGIFLYQLPDLAAGGIEPPSWLTEYHWAKPAIMIMGLWGAIGSNNMLLYLAGLSNVPQELYEAADIDGASRFQKFWHVTWPQLAPVTFFIVVMTVIGGLQGGFEMARTMTKGGPAGSTTTLSYFIYTEGFETGRLGYSSAVAWTLFLMVLICTLFNWKFGNQYVND